MGKVHIGKKLDIDQCKPGMKVMEDVRSDTGSILVTPGVTLTDELINRLKRYKVSYITVKDEGLDVDIKDDEYLEGKLETNQNKHDEREENLSKYKSKVNLESNSIYKSSIRTMNNILAKLDKGKHLDFHAIKKITYPLFNEIIRSNNFLICLYALKKRNEKMYSHSVNVAIFAGLIGKWLRLNDNMIKNLILGGLLHDIGIVKILNNSGYIDKKEYRKHPLLGYREVLNIKDLNTTVKKMILSHHENCDGTGYPFGLTRENISFEARILAVADRFDEVYFDEHEEDGGIFLSLKKLYYEELTRLDFKVLDVFVKNMLWNNIGRYAILSDNRIAKIIFINYYDKFKPLVKTDDAIIDLSTEQRIKIKKVI